MDFRLSDGQQLLVNTARDFLRRKCSPGAMAKIVASERGFSPDLWKEISVLGWPGLLVPPEYGGSGGGLIDVCLLAEELGRACFPGPYVTSAVVATSLVRDRREPGWPERVVAFVFWALCSFAGLFWPVAINRFTPVSTPSASVT